MGDPESAGINRRKTGKGRKKEKEAYKKEAHKKVERRYLNRSSTAEIR
jgi:hypothetical protein